MNIAENGVIVAAKKNQWSISVETGSSIQRFWLQCNSLSCGPKLAGIERTFFIGDLIPFSALTLLVWRQEGHLAWKNWVLVCWW